MVGTTGGSNERATDSQAHEHLEILARVSQSLLGAIDLDEQLALTLRMARGALGGDRGSIMLITETDRLKIVHAEGLPSEALNETINLGEGIAGWVAENNEPVALHGDVNDPRFVGHDPSIGSALSLPLEVDSKVLGVLNIVRKEGARFTTTDLQLATALADLASVALEKSRLYSTLKEREERVSALLKAAIGAQEDERRRIAAEIHDGILQNISALFLRAEEARMFIDAEDPDKAIDSLGRLQEQIRQQMDDIRDFIFEVRPPSLDEIGLGPTLRAMVERAAGDHAIEGKFSDDLGEERLDDGSKETILYRTAQEALRNVTKHAKADQVVVSVGRDGKQAVLVISDNGKGMTPEDHTKHGHFGIQTMRERIELAGGDLQITSSPGEGTRLEARLPL